MSYGSSLRGRVQVLRRTTTVHSVAGTHPKPVLPVSISRSTYNTSPPSAQANLLLSKRHLIQPKEIIIHYTVLASIIIVSGLESHPWCSGLNPSSVLRIIPSRAQGICFLMEMGLVALEMEPRPGKCDTNILPTIPLCQSPGHCCLKPISYDVSCLC